jgi:uncharacterized protein (TIGR02996 family)
MDEENGLIQAILDCPADEVTRLVYVDWLEERGDSRAEFLRTQVALAALSPGHPSRASLQLRLRELRSGLDGSWVALFDRSAIESCGLQFQFQCPKQWEKLRPTGCGTVRFCEACQRRVYYCHSVKQAEKHARRGHCVAVDSTLQRKPGDLGQVIALGVIASAPQPLREEPTEWRGRQRDRRRGDNRPRHRAEDDTEDTE